MTKFNSMINNNLISNYNLQNIFSINNSTYERMFFNLESLLNPETVDIM